MARRADAGSSGNRKRSRTKSFIQLEDLDRACIEDMLSMLCAKDLARLGTVCSFFCGSGHPAALQDNFKRYQASVTFQSEHKDEDQSIFSGLWFNVVSLVSKMPQASDSDV